jgi:glycerol-3-phosphate O-acyltransferase
MTETISIPLWLVIIGGAFAAWALFNRIMVPGVRWFLRRRVESVIKEVNRRLDIKLPDFELTRRKILIDRLTYDPQVLQATEAYSNENDVPREVAVEKVKRYAREIVPSFNAYIYFRIGSWLSRFFARLLYRVRVGFIDEQGLAKVSPQSSIVFVMNHRSNMDYILLAYLAINRVALSFAAGEWARFWPVQQLARAMGAFFVRRGSKNKLYRAVLARYVQMATEGGVVQAVYLEGLLSKDGRMGEPRIGLLDYMLRSFDPDKERDIVFIPVAINYDRVLEDRTLLLSSEPNAEKISRLKAVRKMLFFALHNLRLMLRGEWYRFGYAVSNFGTPVSMRKYIKDHDVNFQELDKDERIEKVKLLASELMAAISNIMPVVPVSSVAFVFAEKPHKTFSALEVKARVKALLDGLEKHGAHVYVPRKDLDYSIKVGLRMLTLRHIVIEENGLFRASEENTKILRFYANSIAHLLHQG